MVFRAVAGPPDQKLPLRYAIRRGLSSVWYTKAVPVSERRWLLVILGLIFLVTLGARLEWDSLPRFLDSYYHLAVIQGFQQAGGVALHAFWEMAPEGRPHLYPPLFHLIWAPVVWLTDDPVTVARLWSVLGAPLLLLGIAWAVHTLAGIRLAALTVIAALLPSGLYLSTLLHPTANLAALGVLGIWVALERGRILAGGLLTGLLGYLHPGIPWVVLLALALLGAVDRQRRQAWPIAGIGLALMAPWWLHVARHLSTLEWIRQPEWAQLEGSPIFLILGLWGLVLAWRQVPTYRFPLALLAAALPWLILYPYRIVSAQGLLPLALLAPILLQRKGVRPLLLGALLVVSPTVAMKPLRVIWADTGLMVAIRGVPLGRGHLEALYDPPRFAEIAQPIRQVAHPDDLLFSNYQYMAGLCSVLTGLATTTSMVAEQGRQPWALTVAHARWIVWFKIPADLDPENDRLARQLAQRHRWALVQETPIAWVYEVPTATSRRIKQGLVIPWWLCYGLLAPLLAGLAGGLGSLAVSRRRASRRPALPS